MPIALRLVAVFLLLSAMGDFGCTALISDKPIFPSGEYDADSLLGHYSGPDGGRVLVTRGLNARITILAFGYKSGEQAGDPRVLTQTTYADAAAIALGNGDYVLQVARSALINERNDESIQPFPIGGKKSPYRGYTAYAIVGRDRKEGQVWVLFNFAYANSSKSQEAEWVFNKNWVTTAKDDPYLEGDSVRIIPPDISRLAAKSLFHDLVTLGKQEKAEVYERTDHDPRATDEERRAIVLNNASTCYRVQNEYVKPPPPPSAPPPPSRDDLLQK